MTMSNFPSGFNGGVVIQGLPVLNSYPSNVFWVHSAGQSVGDGTFNKPFATISAALSRCVAARGDIIMVKSGHAETLNAQSISKSGVKIVGLGSGDDRPAITTTATASAFTVDAANVLIRNLRFPGLSSGTQGGTRKITVSASRCTIESCAFIADASDDDCIYVDYNGSYCTITSNEFHVTANGPDRAITLEGATGGTSLTGVRIVNNLFNGMNATNAWDEGGVYSSGVHLQCVVERNNFLFLPTNIGGIEFVAACTGLIRDNFFGGGTIAEMLDPGSCYCMQNYESDAIDKNGRVWPSVNAS